MKSSERVRVWQVLQRISTIEHGTLNIESRASNIWHPNLEEKSRKDCYATIRYRKTTTTSKPPPHPCTASQHHSRNHREPNFMPRSFDHRTTSKATTIGAKEEKKRAPDDQTNLTPRSCSPYLAHLTLLKPYSPTIVCTRQL